MKLNEKLEELRVLLSLFPKCFRCGRDLSAERLTDLRIAVEHPNRFACRECRPERTHVA